MNPNLECFARRVEPFELNGMKFVLKELPTAADLSAMKDDPDYSMKVVVMCTFMEDGVTPAFTLADIPDMKGESGLFKMMKLVAAVHKVNGMVEDEEVKNSSAAPSGG